MEELPPKKDLWVEMLNRTQTGGGAKMKRASPHKSSPGARKLHNNPQRGEKARVFYEEYAKMFGPSAKKSDGLQKSGDKRS